MGWIRIDGGLTWHWKLIDLRTRLNQPLAEAYLQRLWLWCHDNAPDGELLGLDPASAVETAVQWDGTPGVLTAALIDSGFIDRDSEGKLSVHDWDEHNGKHIKKAKADAKRAKKNRETFKKHKQAESAKRTRTVRERSADESGNETERDETERNGSVDKKEEAGAGAPDPDLLVYERWRELYAPRAAVALTEKRRKLIRARRKERPPATAQQELLDSLAGWRHDPWAGRRDQVDLELLLRDAGQVDKGLRLAPSAAGPPPSLVMCRNHPDKRALNPMAELCGDCELARMRPEAQP